MIGVEENNEEMREDEQGERENDKVRDDVGEERSNDTVETLFT